MPLKLKTLYIYILKRGWRAESVQYDHNLYIIRLIKDNKLPITHNLWPETEDIHKPIG